LITKTTNKVSLTKHLSAFNLATFVLTTFVLTTFVLTTFVLTTFVLTTFVLTTFVLTTFVLITFALPTFVLTNFIKLTYMYIIKHPSEGLSKNTLALLYLHIERAFDGATTLIITKFCIMTLSITFMQSPH
jgi:hypothetical protein